MSRLFDKLADLIGQEVEAPDEQIEAAAAAIIEFSGDLWEDAREHPPPVGEQLLFCGPKGAVFLGKAMGGPMTEDRHIWVRINTGCRKARLWMEPPKGKVVE